MLSRVTLTTAAAGAFAASSALTLCALPQPVAIPAMKYSEKRAFVLVNVIASHPNSQIVCSSLDFLSLLSESADFGPKIVQRKTIAPAQVDNFLLLLDHFARNRRNLVCYFIRDSLNAVTVAMDQIARLNVHISHHYILSEINNVSIGV